MMIKQYRKKPVVIEAMRLTEDTVVEARNWCSGYYEEGSLLIHTLEGDMVADQGDYIIKGIKGEFYPCKPDIFRATYEDAEWLSSGGLYGKKDTVEQSAAYVALNMQAAQHEEDLKFVLREMEHLYYEFERYVKKVDDGSYEGLQLYKAKLRSMGVDV